MPAIDLWKSTNILDGDLLRRKKENYNYLMKLENKNLLVNFQLEAGRTSFIGMPADMHGGWESPGCQLRGHFLGHYLSAAAMYYYTDKDEYIRAKAEVIIEELAACQKDNGGKWAGPIPEKYLYWIAEGKPVWAPHYTIHKVFMGLVDMYLLADSQKALQVAENFADWFYEYSHQYTRSEMDDILDFETGGMLEIWAQLYHITKSEKYKALMERYYRKRLFDPLLCGEDPLTNMHANTTIPEILGCVSAYEATGEKKWKRIVEAYWKCAVTDRGAFITGGQTCGEIWTPMQRLGARLGDKNQEHCTVYNMMRLAGILFSWTKDPVYADYYERNLHNGIMAQGYWRGELTNGQESRYPDHGLLTYFLPMRPGGRKGWGSETGDFFCCHGTLVQANAAIGQGIYFQEGKDVFVCQHFDSEVRCKVGEEEVYIRLKEDNLAGSFHLSSDSDSRQSISHITSDYPDHPDCRKEYLQIRLKRPVDMTLHLRIPEWAIGETEIMINGEPAEVTAKSGTFAVLSRIWQDGDQVMLVLRQGIRLHPLPGQEELMGFTYGPIALVGLTEQEETIYVEKNDKAAVLQHSNEREWGSWKQTFKTRNQQKNLLFVPLKDIGYEPYTVYFRVAEA